MRFFWVKTNGTVEEITEEQSKEIGTRTASKRTVAILRTETSRSILVIHQESFYEHDVVKLTRDQIKAIAGLIE